MPKKTRHWVRLVWKKCPVSTLHDTTSGPLGSNAPRAAVGKRISSGAKMAASRATGKGG